MRETTAVRNGEEIAADKLSEYLRGRLSVRGDLYIEQFPAGSSNLTYLITVGNEELVLRRPPFGNTVKSAHDMGREFNVLTKLSAVYAPAPKPLLFCGDESIIGSEFYLMERRHGLIVRGKFPPTHQSNRIPLRRNFISNLADLHTLAYAEAGLESLGHSEGDNRRQVEGWTKRYFAAKTDEHKELE